MSGSAKQQALSENQKKAQQYLKDHRIEEIFGDILNTISHKKYEQPLVYMIKYLAKQLPVSVLASNGIIVENTEDIESIRQISYPQFDPACNNLFKQSLTKSAYLQLKETQTAYNNDLRHLIKLALENQKSKVGLYATDPDCSKTFNILFNYATSQLFTPLDMNFKYNNTVTMADINTAPGSSIPELKFIEEFSIKLKRNIRNYSFNSSLKSTDRQHIAQELLQTLKDKFGNVFSQHFNLSDLNTEERTNLAAKYNKLIKDANALTRDGTRYNEWPENRHIAISNNKRHLLWLNKEDHCELKCIGNKENNFMDQLLFCMKFIEQLDQEVGFSFNENEGFSVVKPVYSGLGIKYKLKLKVNQQHLGLFKDNLSNFKKNKESALFEIKPMKKDSNRWMIILRNAYNIESMYSLMIQTQKLFEILFNSSSSSSTEKQISPSASIKMQGSVGNSDQSLKKSNAIPNVKQKEQQREDKIENQEEHLKFNQQQQLQQQQLIFQNIEVQSKNDEADKSQSIKPDHIEITILEEEDESTSKINESNINIDNKEQQNNGQLLIATSSNNNNNHNSVINKFKQFRRISDPKELREIILFIGQASSDDSINFTKTNDKESQSITEFDHNTNTIEKIIPSESINQRYSNQFDLDNILSALDRPCVVLRSPEFIKQSYLILRRNFKNFPLKSSMTEVDFQTSNDILNEYFLILKVINDISKNIQDQFGGEIIHSTNKQYETQVNMIFTKEFQVFEDTDVHELIISFDGFKYPYGTILFASNNSIKSFYIFCCPFSLFAIGNLDDHLTIILRIVQDDLIESVKTIQTIQQYKEDLFLIDEQYGYVTRNPRLAGVGIQMVYQIKDSLIQQKGIQKQYIMTQIDENSSVITSNLAHLNCIQIELCKISANNLQEFTQEINNQLGYIKLQGENSNVPVTANYVSKRDCFNGISVIAPEKECYSLFHQSYIEYLSQFNLNETALSLKYLPSLLVFNDLAGRDIKVTYSLGRNFQNLNFTKYLTPNEVANLQKHFERVFASKTEYCLNNKEESNGNNSNHNHDQIVSYKTISYVHQNKYFYVDAMKDDHVEIFSFGKLKELQKSLLESFEILQSLQNDRFQYARDEKLGYLSTIGNRLGDNFFLKVQLTAYQDELDMIHGIAKEYSYNMLVETGNTAAKNPQNHSGQQQVVLELSRCGYFHYEMEMIKRLLFSLPTERSNQLIH